MPDRHYVPGADDTGVLKLRAKVWGSDHAHTNPEFLKWLFQDTPEGQGGGIVSERDGEIVGFAGIARRSARMGSMSFNVAHGLDFMVDPDLHGMNSGRIGLRLLKAHLKRCVELGADFTLNYPNDHSVRMLVSSSLGYQTVLEPGLFVRPLDGFELQESDNGKALGRLAKTALARMVSTYSSYAAKKPSSNADIQKVEKIDERFDDFFNRLTTDGRLRFTRNSSWLQWRYYKHPIYTYDIHVATRQGLIVGYVVTSQRDVFDTHATLICDLCVVGENSDLGQALVSSAVDDARSRNGSIVVGQSLAGSANSKALLRTGFIRIPERANPKQFRMVASGLTDHGSLAVSPENWFFAWGDMDVV